MNYPYISLNGISDTAPILNQTATLKDIINSTDTIENYLPLTGGDISGNLFINGLISSDNNKIVSDGSGNLTIMNNGSIVIWPEQKSIPGVKISSSGDSTLSIQTTNGSNGNLSLGALLANLECKFANGSYSDPEPGSTRDAKFGNNGISVSGGIYTDTIRTKTSGTLFPEVVTSNSGDSATIEFTLPSDGVYAVNTIVSGVSSTTGNVVQQGFNDFSIYQNSNSGQIAKTIQESSYTSFGNVSSWSVKPPVYENNSYTMTCTSTDGDTAGVWTWYSRINYLKIV